MFYGLMQAAVVQMCVLPMYEQLENRSIQRFANCLAASFFFVFVLFVSFSSVAYLTYGPHVSSNILQNLPASPMTEFGRLGMAVAVIAVYPIMLSSMVAPIRHSEERAAEQHRALVFPSPAPNPQSLPVPVSSPSSPLLWPNPASPGSSPSPPITPPPEYQETLVQDAMGFSRQQWHWFGVRRSFLSARRSFWILVPMQLSKLVTLLVLASSAIAASCIQNLGLVNIISGAISVFGLVALAPGLIGFFVLGRFGQAWRFAMGVLIVLGAAVSVIGIRFTANHIDEVAATCMWTIAS